MESRLPKDFISQPELWRCVLHIAPSRLNVALIPPVAQEEMVAASIMLNPDAPSELKALEDAIYDNPLLLSDFPSVTCLVEPADFAVVPAEIVTPDSAPSLLAACLGKEVNPERVACSEPFGGAVAVYELPEALEAFLRRTFFGVKISTPLEEIGSAVCEMSESRAVPVMLGVADTASSFILASARQGMLLMLNRFAVSHPNDAAYYLLASRSTLGLTKEDGTVCFAGAAPLGRTVANIVEPYIDSVGMLPLPQELCGYGKEVTRLSYPLIRYLQHTTFI